MVQKRNGQRRLVLLAICFVGLFVLSSIVPLDNQIETQIDTLETLNENYSPSAIDFSALWNRTYGGFSSDRFQDIAHCVDGGYAIVGQTHIGFDKNVMDQLLV